MEENEKNMSAEEGVNDVVENDTQNQNNNESEKTFTQAEVNRMMKAEKEKGRRSILKELGVEEVKNAKDSLEAYQKYLDGQKTDLQKATEDLQNANAKVAEAEKRAQKAEFCLKAIGGFGAVSESVDDLIAIAITKINDDKDISVVLKEMKENKAYCGFFNNIENKDSQKSKGTGNPPSNNKPAESKTESYGAMLAKRNLQKINKNNGGN